VVKVLLEREGVNPEEICDGGRTPLSHAAENGHAGVVKELLGRDEVNPDMPDGCCLTPLAHAAWNGHEGAVKTLRRKRSTLTSNPMSAGHHSGVSLNPDMKER